VKTPQASTTITTYGHGHGLQGGDIIVVTMIDRRWWRRLVYWLLRRGQPMRTVRRRVTVINATTLTLR
jgi:hypothetical protein